MLDDRHRAPAPSSVFGLYIKYIIAVQRLVYRPMIGNNGPVKGTIAPSETYEGRLPRVHAVLALSSRWPCLDQKYFNTEEQQRLEPLDSKDT